MSNAAKAHEPTMEEILASIRRIIADDEPGAEKPAEAKPAAPAKAAAPKPAAPAPAEEATPSMGQDDIDAMLASFDSSPAPEPAAAAPAEKEEDVLDLTKPVTKAAPQAAELDFVESDGTAEAAEDDGGWGTVEAEPEPMPAPRAPAMPSAAVSRAVGDALLAPEAGTAVASAFSSLAHTILGQNARTLDDLVEEMLRPMLKNWLDDNLPGIVERLVRAEIERVSRGPKR